MTEIRLYDTMAGRSASSSRSIGIGSRCMSAARPSTAAPISAMPGRRWCSTCSPGCCATFMAADKVVHAANVTDIEDKIMAAAAAEQVPIETITGATATSISTISAGSACRGRTSSRSRPARSREMIAMIGRLIDAGHAYAAEGHVLFDVPGWPGLRQAVAAADGRDDRRRAGRRRALQEIAGRFRAVEAERGGAAGLGQPLGPRPAGLAYRMLGDDRGASGRDDRHSRRRHRPRIPAPRERDRPVALRPSRARRWPITGCTTACSRWPRRRCRRASATW